MIRVRISKDGASRFMLSVSGHAGYAPEGQDVVCAAASMLTETWAAAAKELTPALTEPPVLRMEHGEAFVDCDVFAPGERMKAYWMFYALELGFQRLAEDYPEYVELEVISY